jgi:cobalt-zinc-cadmium efflux system protein
MAHDHHRGDHHDHAHDDHGHENAARRADAHNHAGHSHAHHHAVNERRLFWTALLTGAFMVVEAIGGIIAGSLALLADAGHMLADFGGLFLAWMAFRVSRWPADHRRTYGLERMQVLVAFGNGLALFAIAGWIVIEATRRLMDPEPVLGGTMLAIATLGLAVNIAIYLVLHGADRENLNVRGAMIHVLGDLFGSAGAIAAAVVIMATGWTAADPLISVLVAVIILRSAWFVVRDSAHILLEGTPPDLSTAEVKADLQSAIPDVEDIHHVHAWSITQERPMVTLHARICDTADPDRTIIAIKKRLRSRFGISHATIEIERAACADQSPALAPNYEHSH